MMKTRCKKIIAGTGGSQVAEAALVLPLAFLMLLGIYWFGRAFNVYATINHAAREGARTALASTCGSCTPPNSAPTASTIAGVVTTTLQASNVDPSKISLYAPTVISCPGATSSCNNSNNNITICSQVELAANPETGSGPPVCGVSVTFEYPYSFSLPYPASGINLLLKADVQMSAEN
jgi:hypothetical protein